MVAVIDDEVVGVVRVVVAVIAVVTVEVGLNGRCIVAIGDVYFSFSLPALYTTAVISYFFSFNSAFENSSFNFSFLINQGECVAPE